MILVVADTGPLCYLILIEAIGLLPQLYDRVVIPSAVLAE
jgi:predicted nucleic acid-binding protein